MLLKIAEEFLWKLQWPVYINNTVNVMLYVVTDFIPNTTIVSFFRFLMASVGEHNQDNRTFQFWTTER